MKITRAPGNGAILEEAQTIVSNALVASPQQPGIPVNKM